MNLYFYESIFLHPKTTAVGRLSHSGRLSHVGRLSQSGRSSHIGRLSGGGEMR